MTSNQQATTRPSSPERGPLRIAWLAVEPTPYDLPLIEDLKQLDGLDVLFLSCIPDARFPWIERERLNRLLPTLKGLHFIPPGKDITATLNLGVLRELWRRPLDLAVIAGWGNPTCLLAALICLFRRIPFMLRADKRLDPAPAKRWRASSRLLVLPIIRRSAACLGISKPATTFFTHVGVPKERVFLVPCLSHLDEYRQAFLAVSEATVDIRSELDTPPGACVGIYAGRLEKVKGVDILLEGLRGVQPQERPFLWIAGDGSRRASLEHFAKTHALPVRFLGFQRNDRLPLYYRSADFLALPSRHEQWGIVVAEAMSCGLPVVLSEYVGARFDLLREGTNGFVVKGNDPAEWSQVLRRCAAERDRLARLGRSALETTSEYGKEASVREFLAAVETVFPITPPRREDDESHPGRRLGANGRESAVSRG